MIDLHTGIPGSGKTLSMVEELAKLQKRWEKFPDEARPIFVHNIKDLALPHAVMPLISVQVHRGGESVLVPDWDLMPDGSLAIIDEAQNLFPPRSSQSAMPAHVAWLNTHRHKGFDIWFTTQHPKLIDSSVRALVGRHKHFRRLFGGRRAVVYEWDACSDSLGGMKTAVKTYYPYPKKVFEWYKSAEIHTKQRFKLPLWLGIPFIAVAIGVFAVPSAYSTLSSGMAGKGLGKDKASDIKPQSPKMNTTQATSGAAGAFAPQQAAPVAKTEPSSVPEVKYVGCISSKDKCSCVKSTGEVVINPPQCKESSQSFGGLVSVTVQPSSTNSLLAPGRTSDAKI